MTRTQLYIVGALAILVLGATTFFTFLRPEPRTALQTWTGDSGLLPWNEGATVERSDERDRFGEGIDSLGTVPLPTVSETASEESFATDLAKLLTQLTEPMEKKPDSDPIVPSSYAFIPRGLISIGETPPPSPDQQAFREYGNSLGITLQAFANAHPDMPQTLKDQAEDRSNSLKVAALKQLAADFTRLGDTVAAMGSVPSGVTSANQALAAAYRDVGTKLAKIPDATADEPFLAAINTYNTSAENLSRRLVAISDLFVSRNVGFTTSDPGNIFMFSGQTSF
ncbi:MAG: hypothetical protein WA021_04115 [Minisyncoccia bacterium]